MPVPVLLVALVEPLVALLVDVPLVLEVVAAAPPLPPWPPPPLVALAVPDAVVVLEAPPAPVLVLEVVLSPPQPAAMIPIPVMASVQRIQPSSSFRNETRLCADRHGPGCYIRVN
jgi:hypothetical protein